MVSRLELYRKLLQEKKDHAASLTEIQRVCDEWVRQAEEEANRLVRVADVRRRQSHGIDGQQGRLRSEIQAFETVIKALEKEDIEGMFD